MSFSEYNISLYSPESLHQVVGLMQYLWGYDFDNNLNYFKWKYDENPYAKVPLGMVASIDSSIVGFRGYFATKWHIPSKDREIIVLNPGDTVVHPDHRMKGLSVKMGRMAMEVYASEYSILLNHSTSAKSTPGYLKMGFKPLLAKTILSKYNSLGLSTFLIMSRLKPDAVKEKVVFGHSGQFTVSDKPRPEDMSVIIANQPRDDSRISLMQDEVFYRWRYNNQRNSYVFYYYKERQTIDSFIVVRLSRNGRRGYICDYGAIDNHSFNKILKFIIKKKHFDVLSIYNLNIPPHLYKIFSSAGFREKNILRSIEQKINGVWPILIRPVNRNVNEADWFTGGIDLRQKDSWVLKEICSDSS